MINFTRRRLEELFGEFPKQRVVVVGDLMLDRYIWGRVSRVSPEAPVPVVEVDSESVRFGGAANVVHNVQSLGAEVLPVGVIGDDGAGQTLCDLFAEKGIPVDGLVVDKERPTTVKARVIADSQHVVRTDWEARRGVSKKIQDRILDCLQDRLEAFDGVILQDYNKGLLVPRLIAGVIGLAKPRGKMTFVDPKFDHFFDYRGVTLFKPNRKEVADRLGVRLDSDGDLEKAGWKVLERLQCGAVLITLGGGGMILFERGKPCVKVPTKAVKVHDVSGAGDTVIASLAVAMLAGATPREAATIANHAAGIVCGEVGIVPVERERLFQNLLEDMDGHR